jgi:hypothetical protein
VAVVPVGVRCRVFGHVIARAIERRWAAEVEAVVVDVLVERGPLRCLLHRTKAGEHLVTPDRQLGDLLLDTHGDL